jgi:hypothetical protein
VAVLGFQSGICHGGFKKHAMPLEIPNVHNASLRMDQLYSRHELRCLKRTTEIVMENSKVSAKSLSLQRKSSSRYYDIYNSISLIRNHLFFATLVCSLL